MSGCARGGRPDGDPSARQTGVGSVRFLQTRIAAAVDRLPDLAGRRIGVVTGRAMGSLMPQVLADVAAPTGGRFELVVVENTLFGPSVTTAGLLPGAAVELALRVPMPVRLSYDFADVLSELGSRNAEVGTEERGSAFCVPRSAFGA